MLIQHNMESINARRQHGINNLFKTKSTEKLASGYRINRAADDAAGLTISEEMREQIRGLHRGNYNTEEGIDWIKVADGAMAEIESMLHRINELAIQASNDTNTFEDRNAINKEISQIKKEINNISLHTEYNTIPIFDNSYVTMDASGVLDGFGVFDATYDDTSGEVTFGGFIFDGHRVSWDDFAPGMVKNENGKQVFVGGTYTGIVPATGDTFQIRCEDGAEPPEVTRIIDFSATDDGILVDNTLFGWENLIDEDGNALTPGNIHGGAWMFNYKGGTVAFFVDTKASTYEDIKNAINSSKTGKASYVWQTLYLGTKAEDAVHTSVVKDVKMSQELARELLENPSSKYVVHADENGISLTYNNGTSDVDVPNSHKSWANLGITSWFEGNDIQGGKNYTYEVDDIGLDVDNKKWLVFDFDLSDVTSVDSVIDGLDGMEIDVKNIRTSYSTTWDVKQDSNIVSATISNNNIVHLEDEFNFGRDFNAQTVPDMISSQITIDHNNHQAELIFSQNGHDLKLTGDTTKLEDLLYNRFGTYFNHVIDGMDEALLNGRPFDVNDLGQGSLLDIIGNDHATTKGDFSALQFTIPNPKPTDWLFTPGHNGFPNGEAGKTYPAAFINFEGLGRDYVLDDLNNLGFNSTCRTCDNHYSVRFLNNVTTDLEVDGFKYNKLTEGNHYTLEIDLNSLKNSGVTTGEDLAKALVKIASSPKGFDFHYTQYAADNTGMLYIYDDRVWDYGVPPDKATFNTAPYFDINVNTFDLNLKTDDNRAVNIQYVYNCRDMADLLAGSNPPLIEMNMLEDPNGNFVKNDDGSYSVYDPAVHGTNRPLYVKEIIYKDKNGNFLANEDAFKKYILDDYIQSAMKKLFEDPNISLNATDYTKFNASGNVNGNTAIRALFDTEAYRKTDYTDGLHIQHSSRQGDATVLPRFPMNTVYLKLYAAGTKTYEQAQKTITLSQKALTIINDARSLYGAYQNRFEHACSVIQNMEENTQAAESRLRDTDMASEIIEYSKSSILQQSTEAILAQANQSKNGVLQLLQF